MSSVLSIFPNDTRPRYVPFPSNSNQKYFVKRAILISIAGTEFDCVLSVNEAILVRKAAYRYANVTVNGNKPQKLKVLFLVREGNTRQILNEKDFINAVTNNTQITLEKTSFLNSKFGDQVRKMSTTDIIVSVHGAGLVNVIFMVPYSGLLEIFAKDFYVEFYYNIAVKSRVFYDTSRNNKSVFHRNFSRITYKHRRESNLIIQITETVGKLEKLEKLVWAYKYYE